MKCIVQKIAEQNYRGNKAYRFYMRNMEDGKQFMDFIEPRNARALRDALEVASINDLVGCMIELQDKKK